MVRFFRRFYKPITILIAVTLIAQLFIFFPFGKAGNQEILADSNPEQDKQIAADISNLTGASIEEIMKIKGAGKSWNEVMEILKSTSRDTLPDKDQRNKLLTGAGIAEDDMKQWLDEGYTNEEIVDARMMAERVQFQLREMTEESPFKQVEKPTAELSLVPKKEDKQGAYKKIAEGYELKTAVSFMLRLKKEIGSLEAVLDEYLLSLQIGISLEDYMKDKSQYMKQKEEKSLGMRDQFVTLSVLEQDLLDKMKSDHGLGKDDDPPIQPKKEQDGKGTGSTTPLPDVPVPAIKDVKPMNPAEAINNELKRIDPNQR